MIDERFGDAEQALLNALLPKVEQLVGDHYRLTSFGPIHRCYEVVTLEAADHTGRCETALAKLCRFDRLERAIGPERVSHFYRVYLQDDNLLARAREPGASLRALLLYVLTHELVHIVRFESFQVPFGAAQALRGKEERAVHALTLELIGALREQEVDRLAKVLARQTVDIVE